MRATAAGLDSVAGLDSSAGRALSGLSRRTARSPARRDRVGAIAHRLARGREARTAPADPTAFDALCSIGIVAPATASPKADTDLIERRRAAVVALDRLVLVVAGEPERLTPGWRAPIRGMAEIDVVLAEFSQRRAQIVAYLADAYAAGWRTAQVATLKTRERKEDVDLAPSNPRLGCPALRSTASACPAREAVLRRVVWAPPATEKHATFGDPDVVKA